MVLRGRHWRVTKSRIVEPVNWLPLTRWLTGYDYRSPIRGQWIRESVSIVRADIEESGLWGAS